MLGIDPGSAVTGWGVVEVSARGISYVASGTLQTRGSATFPDRLRRIHEGLLAVISTWAPTAVVVERTFVARNVQAALRLGEARGVALLGAAVAGLPVHEYTPAVVKLAVTGSGSADKAQVARGIARLLGIDAPLRPDAADALAVAVCHGHSAGLAGRLARMPLPRAPGRARIGVGVRRQHQAPRSPERAALDAVRRLVLRDRGRRRRARWPA